MKVKIEDIELIEYRYHKELDYKTTSNEIAWKRLRNTIDKITYCTVCSPGGGCHGNSRQRYNNQRCWKSHRLNQYK